MNDNTFVNRVKDLGLETRTLNDAIAYFTSTDVLVDMFGTIGALRDADKERLYRMVDGAYAKDKLLLAKMLFYARDIRGGLGERETFRTAINYCALRYPNVIRNNNLQSWKSISRELRLRPLCLMRTDLYISAIWLAFTCLLTSMPAIFV